MPFSNSFYDATFTAGNVLNHSSDAAIIIVSGIPDDLVGEINGSVLVGNPLDLVALNPQPLPPEPPDRIFGIQSLLNNPLDLVSLNPQPLPPLPVDGNLGIRTLIGNPFDWVALNPQPLPPRELISNVLGNGFLSRFEHW